MGGGEFEFGESGIERGRNLEYKDQPEHLIKVYRKKAQIELKFDESSLEGEGDGGVNNVVPLARFDWHQDNTFWHVGRKWNGGGF